MTATAHQLRRRQAAAELIVARLGTAARRKRFIEAVPLACAASPDAVYAAVAAHTDPPALLVLAETIAAPKSRQRRRKDGSRRG